MGWIGIADQLVFALQVFGADVDGDNRPIVRPGGISSFLGLGEEIVLHDEAQVRIGGRWVRIAPLMGGTSYGMNVTVIM